MNRLIRTVAVPVVLSISLLGCGQKAANNQGVYMLVDTSGTYRNEIDKAAQIVYYTLARLEPTDSFAVARTQSLKSWAFVFSGRFEEGIRLGQKAFLVQQKIRK